MYQKTYIMPKSTGTFADTLAAFGLAVVLREIYEQVNGRGSGKKTHIRDTGPYYEIELPTELKKDWINKCDFFSLAKPIRTRSQPIKELKEALDLDAAWERFREFQKIQETLKKTSNRASSSDSQFQAQLDDLRPTSEFWTMAFIGERKIQAIQIYNSTVLQWHATRDYLPINLRAILAIASTFDSDMDNVASEWSKNVRVKGIKLKLSASQLFSPSQGQGQNRPKANALNVRERPQVFWILQYLRAIGLWYCIAPRMIRKGVDRKAYVLSPINLNLGIHEEVFKNFTSRLWSETTVKMDINAVLLYTESLLEYTEAGQEDELDFENLGPENIVAGFYTSTYKLLSPNSYTMMNLSFIGLPHWMSEIKTRKRVDELKDVIKEHLSIVRNIDEEHSDGYNLLVQYRDFLSGGDLEIFFDFSLSYGYYLMSEWSKSNPNLRVRPFTSKNLRRLIMAKEPNLKDIITVQGFRNIAAAIRHSTVIPQRRKARREEAAYEPDYNLGMELKRVAPFKDKSIAALGAFIQRYMAETLRRMENPRQAEFRGKAMRPRVAQQDLDELLPLIDDFGSEVICNLLLAYGYAWEYRIENDSEAQQDE